MNQLLNNLRPAAFLLVRVVIAYLFLIHGTVKLFVYPTALPGFESGVPVASIFGIAAIMEIVGGILIILGLFTRPTAFLLSGQMAYGYFGFHASAETFFHPILNGGELAALYSVIFLLFVFVGAGKWSLDYKLFNKE